MKKYIVFATLITATIVLPIGWLLGDSFGLSFIAQENNLISPFVDQAKEKRLPLLKYGIEDLQNYDFQPSSIVVKEIIGGTADYSSYLFSYQTLEKTMTGQLNVPSTAQPEDGYPVVIMLRGWVPAETYTTGAGTKSAAAVFAENGYVTLAPDFFGFGGSDIESTDTWEARFQKPISVVELLKTINNNPRIKIDEENIKLSNESDDKHIWAHSNGGQVALTALEISGESIKTTLWAPVTAPFPYSILFFSDEHDDEGSEMRKWLSLFEESYDVSDFTMTQHLNQLQGSIQIHQGTSDDAVPVAWNDEFVEKIELENEKRSESTDSAKLDPIEINYFKYSGTNHNLQPGWNTAIQRDLVFFSSL
ncbi:MAG: hypothetical protein HN730_06475 [Bdellovibrionales bacterium]|nr:hypothetical protein [Bdellovibrionales bacterium]